MSYDHFAATFSKSRKNHPWPELDYIIEDMWEKGYASVLDIGCGNGRFLEEAKKSELKIREYHGVDSSGEMVKEAKKLHPTQNFTTFPMEMIENCWSIRWKQFEAIILLASFHHLEEQESRIKTLKQMKEFLTPNGRIYMTNWNLLGQPKYEKDHRWSGDFDIKIGEFSRYYHGFTIEELAALFHEAGMEIIENRVFDGGRNILSILH